MLHAKRRHPASQQYELSEDGRALTVLALGRGRIGARFTLHGAEHRVRRHRLSGVHELLAADGTVVAATGRVRRSWTMTCSGRTFPFRQTAAAGRECTMLGACGEPVGAIRRTGTGGREITADLPELEPVLRVFALAVVLLRRRRKRAAASARSASLAGG